MMTISFDALPSQTSSQLPHLTINDLRRDLTRLQARLIGGVRGLLFVLALLPFAAQLELVSSARVLALTLALISLTLVLTATQRLPQRIGFALDLLAVALLVQSTGAAHSPYLCVALALIVQGAAIGGRAGALMGGGFGTLLLLLSTLAQPGYPGALVVVLVALHMISAIAVAWLCAVGAAALELLHQDDAPGCAPAPVGTLIDWDSVHIALARCDDHAQLARVACEQAHMLTHVTAHATLGRDAPGGTAASDCDAVSFSFAHGETRGTLTLGCATGALTSAQHGALHRLAALVGVYAALLATTAQVHCQQEVMSVLWQVAGFLRAAPHFDGALRETSRQMAHALRLDWIVLLAPDERRALAPLLITPGHTNRSPRLSGKHMQYALETLQTGNPQVRDEHGHALIYLSLTHTTGSPLVLVASGATAEASTQTALMLFGNLVADGFMTRSNTTAALPAATVRAPELTCA